MSNTEDKKFPAFVVPGPVLDNEALPDAFAPLIRNAWYVVAESRHVDLELRGVRVLGEPLVLYRTEAGEPVVLDDRCAHRRFPLSKSKRVGDSVQCGYHGFTYEPSGRCVWAPGDVKPHFGVRRYPCVEVGPWLWAWMGDPNKADPATVPYPKIDANEPWRKIEGYKLNPGNYMLLIENLLDLSHLHFLHGDHVSDESQANSRSTLVSIPDGVGYIKETPVAQAKLFAQLSGGDPTKPVRVVTTSSQFGPSVNYASEERFALVDDGDPLFPLRFHIVHAITPESISSTHQFFQVFINCDLLIGMEAFRDMSQNVVFQQDCDAIEYMQATIESDRRSGKVEFGFAGDRYALTMRGILRKLKQHEMEVRAEAAPSQ